jgi:type I restriction enzyme M protein
VSASTLVQKLWNYCNVLRDDGMSHGDHVEPVTDLLFLTMADERSRPASNAHGPQPGIIRADWAWYQGITLKSRFSGSSRATKRNQR